MTVPRSAACLAAWSILGLLGAQGAAAETASFTTAGCTSWEVPAGASVVDIEAVGAAGGGAGGLGDGVSGTLSGLTPGEHLFVCVNQGGGAVGAGDFSGGNAAGGGASGLSRGTDFSQPMLVAGGGGGGIDATEFSLGIARGGSAGLPVGGSGEGSSSGAQGGAGGNNTTMQGGAGGAGAGAGAGVTAAGPGQGGTGGAGLLGGNGGGGGYFGGGGGGGGLPGAGGGGGSDFCSGALLDCTVTSGAGTVHGAGSGPGEAKVRITYEDAVTGAGRIGSGAKTNDFVFDAHSEPDGTSPTGTISFTDVANPSKQINGDVVCLRVSGARAVIVYEDSGPAQTGGIINVVDGAPDRQKNGRLAKAKVNQYRTNCPAVATGTLPALTGGALTVTNN
jgi:hypothetical protein